MSWTTIIPIIPLELNPSKIQESALSPALLPCESKDSSKLTARGRQKLWIDSSIAPQLGNALTSSFVNSIESNCVFVFALELGINP